MKRCLTAAALLVPALAMFLAQGTGRPAAQEKEKEKEPAAAAKEERAVLLKSVGLLAASQVYQAYLNVGFMADGKASGTYEEKDLRDILGSVDELLTKSDRQLQQVASLELSRDDRAAIEQVRKLGAQVREQSEELQTFWKTGAAERGERYEKLRKQSWEGISALLGLDKKK